MIEPVIEKTFTISVKSEGIETDPEALITYENMNCTTYFVGDIVEINTARAKYEGRIVDINNEILKESSVVLDISSKFNREEVTIKFIDIKSIKMYRSKENIVIRRKRI